MDNHSEDYNTPLSFVVLPINSASNEKNSQSISHEMSLDAAKQKVSEEAFADKPDNTATDNSDTAVFTETNNLDTAVYTAADNLDTAAFTAADNSDTAVFTALDFAKSSPFTYPVNTDSPPPRIKNNEPPPVEIGTVPLNHFEASLLSTIAYEDAKTQEKTDKIKMNTERGFLTQPIRVPKRRYSSSKHRAVYSYFDLVRHSTDRAVDYFLGHKKIKHPPALGFMSVIPCIIILLFSIGNILGYIRVATGSWVKTEGTVRTGLMLSGSTTDVLATYFGLQETVFFDCANGHRHVVDIPFYHFSRDRDKKTVYYKESHHNYIFVPLKGFLAIFIQVFSAFYICYWFYRHKKGNTLANLQSANDAGFDNLNVAVSRSCGNCGAELPGHSYLCKACGYNGGM